MIHLPFFDRAFISNYKWVPCKYANTNFGAIRNKKYRPDTKVATVFSKNMLKLICFLQKFSCGLKNSSYPATNNLAI